MRHRPNVLIGLAAAGLFILVIVLANWAVEKWGPVPVGFGLEAPAGVYFAGLAFTLRDVVHRCLGGRVAVFPVIALGFFVSLLVGAGDSIPGGVTTIALAGAVAFLVSELADLFVYEPIRKRGWLPAVLASNAVGIVIDSALFLYLAFGSFAFFWGQVVGKAWMTLAAVLVLSVWAAAARARGGDPESAVPA